MFQPPQGRPPLPIRRILGLPACAVLGLLRSAGLLAPSALPEFARAAGLLDIGQGIPTDRQLRTLRGYLRRLAHHGLVGVDEAGTWYPTADVASGSGQAPPADLTTYTGTTTDIEQLGWAACGAVRDRIDAERAQFRDRVDPTARRARWERQRQEALRRSAKADRARQKAWWAALQPDEQHRRRARRADWFDALSPAEQATHKTTFAQRRARAGEHEVDRYRAWLEHLHPADLAQRCIDRAAAFAGRPAHEQQQLVGAWADHRARWRLPHPRRQPPAPAAESAARHTAPEAALLTRPAVDLEQLVLFETQHCSTSRPAVKTPVGRGTPSILRRAAIPH